MADNSGNETKFHIYTGIGTGPLGESKLHIKSDGPSSSGPRLTLGEAQLLRDEKNWMTVMSGAGGIGYCKQGEKRTAGIFTPGQSQCICIIVAIFDSDHDAWSEAWLTHVNSDKDYAKIYGIIGKLDEKNCGRAYVAIGAKHGSLVWMETIRKAFDGTPLPPIEVKAVMGGARSAAPPKASALVEQPQPVCKPAHVWTYSGEEAGDFGFGISEDGMIGQVTGKLKE